MAPNLTEIATTTLRNRGAKMNKKVKTYEGSPVDRAADKRSAKRMGMTAKEYEGSPADRRADIRAAVKSAVASSKKTKK